MNSLASAEVALEEGDPKSLGLVTDIVCFVVLILTLLGAGWMTVSMLRKQYTAGKGSTVRSRLVLFLVFGDFMLGVFGIIPTFATLINHPPRQGSGFCDSMAFLLVATLWAQHLNNVSLCVATYLVLLHPLSEWTRLVERHWFWFLPLVWIASFVFSAVAWAAQGGWSYQNGVCFYKPGLFAEIYQFIPRGIVFTIITILYFRLFVFLRRPDKIRSSTSVDSASRQSSQVGTSSRGGRWAMSRWKTLAHGGDGGVRSRKESGMDQVAVRSRSDALAAMETAGVGPDGRKPSTAGASDECGLSNGDDSLGGGGEARKASATPSDDSMAGGPKDLRFAPFPPTAPPWERLELPLLGSHAVLGSAAGNAPSGYIQSGWGWGTTKGDSGSFGGSLSNGVGSGGQGGNPPLSQDLSTPHSPTSSNASPLKTSLHRPTPLPNVRYRTGNFDPTESQISETFEPRPNASPVQSRRNSRQGSHVSFLDEVKASNGFPPANDRSTHASHPSPSTPSFLPPSSPYSTSSSMSTVHPLHPFSNQYPLSSDRFDSYPGPITPVDAYPPRASTPDPLNITSRRISKQKDILDYSLDSPPDGPTEIAFDPSSATHAAESFTDNSSSSRRSSRQSGSDLTGPSHASRTTTNASATTASSSSPLYTNKTSSSLRRPSTPPIPPPLKPPNGYNNLLSFPSPDLEASLQDDPSRTETSTHKPPLEDDELSLRRILEMMQPAEDDPQYTRRERDRSGAGLSSYGGGGAGGGGGFGQESGTASDGGGNQESMARFMNRKASLLMLSFPLAYILLFSISIVRILYYFVRKEPNAALSAVSRWFVFSQGLVDAFIYGLIEWKVKRTVRRKTRRGHFANAGDPSSVSSSPLNDGSLGATNHLDSIARGGEGKGRGSRTGSVILLEPTQTQSFRGSGSNDVAMDGNGMGGRTSRNNSSAGILA